MVTIIGATQRSLSQQRVNIIDSTGTIIDNFASYVPDMPSGATRVNKTFRAAIAAANTAYTIYTPAGGTSLYITDMSVTNVMTTTGSIRLGDNISGNAYTDDTLQDNVTMFGTQYATTVFHFTVPLIISTALKLIGTNTGTGVVSFSGWEI